MDPHTLSINTVRGEALHAVVEYGLWIHRHAEKEADGEPDTDFSSMPEVRDVLERHLDVSVDSSLAVRAVYGRWFPWLVLLDEAWVTERAPTIFPTSLNDEPYWDAAWGTYVSVCRPYDNVLKVLRNQYERAVDRLETMAADEIERPEERLAGHLMAFYWRGKLDLDGEGSLVERFFDKAPPKVRGHAIAFLGRSLKGTEEEIPEDVRARLRLLWEGRLEAAKDASDAGTFAPELEAFLWWFSSGQMDDQWSLQQLSAATEQLTSLGHSSGFALERLVELGDEFPEECLQCLELMLERDMDQWLPMARKEEIETLLRVGLSRDGEIERRAREIIGRLASKGYYGFRDLISGDSTDQQ